MTRADETHRPGERPLAIVRGEDRRKPGGTLELRRRGDLESPGRRRPPTPMCCAGSCGSGRRTCSG